jgi:hypothetical protein
MLDRRVFPLALASTLSRLDHGGACQRVGQSAVDIRLAYRDFVYLAAVPQYRHLTLSVAFQAA